MSLLLLLRPKYPTRAGLPITYLRTQPKPKIRRRTYVDAFLIAESSSVVVIAAEVTYNFDVDVEELVLAGAI
jgi:hypothetical protein